VETRETAFNQDLNGDGLIGPTTTVIEAHGSTTLAQVADTYFFGGSSGTQLKFGGAPVTMGQFGPWMAIGAEQTGSGYEVIWKIAATNQYTVWATDSSGNYLSNVVGTVPGNSWQLETRETAFNQDLNGDGLIGPTTTVIEANGSTTLAQVADTYFFGGSSGTQLKFGGAPVTMGQFGPWMAIGAEQTGSGYEVVWKIAATNQYTVWATDSSGNYLSNIVGTVSGNSWQVETRETTYNQDLNGDGIIGPTTTMGQLSPWMAISREQTATGYEIAWPGHIAAQDGSSSIVENVGRLGSDFGNVGTLGLDTGSAALLMNDEVGNVGPGGGSVALLTNYIASTFATPAAEGTGAVAASQPSAQDLLTRPAA
jgi:hypothetical protein